MILSLLINSGNYYGVYMNKEIYREIVVSEISRITRFKGEME